MDNLVKKGRSLEAAEKGADKIKGEQKFKTEEQYSVNRMQPKKYSRKYQQRDNRTPNRGEGHSKPSQSSSSQPFNKCRTCSSRSCKGERHCPGKSVTCFTCNLKGHYRVSKACKKSSSARRLESSSEASDTSEYESSYATPRSSTDTEVSDQEEETSRRVRHHKRRPIPGTRRVGGARKTGRKGKTPGKYEVEVIINGKETTAYADTGADLCIMSHENAKHLRLPLSKSRMKIRPYGSKAKSCKGKYTGTVMFGDAVANTTIYVINKQAETLLSGAVCEQLGIIAFNDTAVRSVKANEPELSAEKAELLHTFPNLFDGTGTLADYEVKFHVDPSVRPVCQQTRPNRSI
jgi:hypothetical protein